MLLLLGVPCGSRTRPSTSPRAPLAPRMAHVTHGTRHIDRSKQQSPPAPAPAMPTLLARPPVPARTHIHHSHSSAFSFCVLLSSVPVRSVSCACAPPSLPRPYAYAPTHLLVAYSPRLQLQPSKTKQGASPTLATAVRAVTGCFQSLLSPHALTTSLLLALALINV